MKAFRAYFVLLDVLTDVERANARISFSFDEGTTTAVREIGKTSPDSSLYNLQGQRVEHPRHGLYIKDRKKVIAKE
jgi:hypothetical protein